MQPQIFTTCGLDLANVLLNTVSSEWCLQASTLIALLLATGLEASAIYNLLGRARPGHGLKLSNLWPILPDVGPCCLTG